MKTHAMLHSRYHFIRNNSHPLLYGLFICHAISIALYFIQQNQHRHGQESYFQDS